MTLLMVARWLYVWWPLHPLGYAIGPIWIIDALWFNMFLAWLIKVVVLKYGGVGLYRKTRPLLYGHDLGILHTGRLLPHRRSLHRNDLERYFLGLILAAAGKKLPGFHPSPLASTPT